MELCYVQIRVMQLYDIHCQKVKHRFWLQNVNYIFLQKKNY